MDGSLAITRIAAPVREEVLRVLRSAIVDGRFQPGSRLSERELCDHLGASRTTVREAVRQLETEGFVRSIPGKGLEVASVSVGDARDLFELRASMEGLAARLFVQRASEQELTELRTVLHELLECYAREDIPAILECKDRFYSVLLRGSGNQLLQSFMKTLHGRIKLLRSASLSIPGRTSESARELQEIVDAIADGDGTRAEELSILHVRKAGRGAFHVLGVESPW